MDALLMCGGRGTRLDVPVEKPLFSVDGRPMVDRVADALAASRVATSYAVVSPHAPETGDHVRTHLDLPAIETPGDGYVEDLAAALDRPEVDQPVLTVAADLPLLDGEVVDAVLDAYDGDANGWGGDASMAVCVPASLKRELGVSADEHVEEAWTDGDRELAATGLNVVGPGPESVHVSYDARLAVNVNRLEDAEVAEALL